MLQLLLVGKIICQVVIEPESPQETRLDLGRESLLLVKKGRYSGGLA
jgi:hypothetical protein